MVWDAGAVPVVVLNKADLCEDPAGACESVARRLPMIDVVVVSALEDAGLDALAPYLRPAQTVALLGSSGVGKSTLVNRLLGGETLRVGAISDADGKGRHTTTSRQLVELPGGALLIDTPGMRELQPWGDESAVAAAFDDIATLAAACRFADCAHGGEPGLRGSRGGREPAAWTPTGWRTSSGSGARRRTRRGSTTRRPRPNTSGGGSRSIRRTRRCTAIGIEISGSRIICRHAHAAGDRLGRALLGRAGARLKPSPYRGGAGDVPRPPRDDERADRHRGAPRLGAARRRSLLRAGHRPLLRRQPLLPRRQRAVGAVRDQRRSGGREAVARADDSRRSAEAVERARHGGVRVRRAERADDAGLHRAEGSVGPAGRPGLRAVRPRRRRHGRRRRAEQRVRRERPAAASAPANSSRCSTAATRISTASSRGSIDCFMRW